MGPYKNQVSCSHLEHLRAFKISLDLLLIMKKRNRVLISSLLNSPSLFAMLVNLENLYIHAPSKLMESTVGEAVLFCM